MRMTNLVKLMALALLILILFPAQMSIASNGWSKTYEGDGYDTLIPQSVVQTRDGGNAIAVFADTKRIAEGSTWMLEEQLELWLIKTDSSGNIQWKQTFGDANPLALGGPYTVVQTSDGGYAIGGTAMGYEGWLIKTDSSGRLLWNKTYTYGEGSELGTLHLYSLVQTKDSGYAFAGAVTPYGGSTDFFLMKVDSAGNLKWTKTYDGGTRQEPSGNLVNTDDEAYSLIQTKDGGYALAGQSRVYGTSDFWLVKTDSSGNLEWSSKYWEPYLAGGSHFLEVTHRLVQTSDGGYALAGSEEKSVEDNDFYLIKVDSLGSVQWRKTYGAKYTDVPSSIIQLSDGGFALGGTMTEVGIGGPISKDLAIVRTDSSGNLIWTKTYNAKYNDTLDTKSEEFGYSMCLTSDGAYVIAGTTQNAWDGSHVDIFLVKTETLETTPVQTQSLSLGDVTGQLNVQLPGQDSWTPAAKGISLTEGTKIKTAEAEGASFTLAETTAIQMKPNTLIEIQASTANSQKLQLTQGEFTATVRNLTEGAALQVEMSQAVATVKGTVFTVSETGSESKLTVHEGVVTFTSKTNGVSVDITGGQSVTATAAGLSDIVQVEFPFMAIIVIAVVLAALAAGITLWAFKKKKKETIRSQTHETKLQQFKL
ncbi:MAG: FecR family protein [Candidatus Bathyarchaeota archaeon]|nr:FecR family protein [Candidatus Bathyarchaeota archaeon]